MSADVTLLADVLAADITVANVTDDQLRVISTLAARTLQLESEIARVTAMLETLQQSHRKVTQVDLPDAMRAAGVEAFTTDEGATVALKASVSASISVANRCEAHEWLRR